MPQRLSTRDATEDSQVSSLRAAKVKEKWPTDNEIKALYVIVKAFCEVRNSMDKRETCVLLRYLHFDAPAEGGNLDPKVQLQPALRESRRAQCLRAPRARGAHSPAHSCVLYPPLYTRRSKPNGTAALVHQSSTRAFRVAAATSFSSSSSTRKPSRCSRSQTAPPRLVRFACSKPGTGTTSWSSWARSPP